MLAFAAAIPASANQPPVVDSFTVTPGNPVPGQIVTLNLKAHDPDCATSCTSGCGLSIRADQFRWADDTGRTGQFSGSTTSSTGSPFSASVEWTAPPADGTYTISAYLIDTGGMLCGGSKTMTATLPVTVSSARPPVIDSFVVTPSSVNAGASATLSALAHDPEGRPLSYSFTAEAGTIDHASAQSSTATWTAPPAAGNVTLTCTVTVSDAPPVRKTIIANVTIGEYLGRISVGPYSATRLVAVPNNRIAVVDGASGVLAVGALDGTLTWFRRGLRQPAAVAYLDTRIYVLERKASRISIWSLGGDRLGTLPLGGSLPNDLTADPYLKELYLSDSNRGVVTAIDPTTGASRREVGVGILRSPTGIWAENGTLGVADPGRKRVFVFDRNGQLLSTLGNDSLLVRPQGISRDVLNSNWIITDSFSGEVHVLADDGTVLGTLGGYANDGNLVNPMDSEFLVAQRQIAVPTLSDGVKFFGLTSTVPAPQAAGQPIVVDRPGDDGEALLISWTPSPDDPLRVDRYHVERDNDDGAFARIATLPAGSVTWTDLTAGDGVCHSYRVVASDGILDTASAPSACEFALNDRPPDPATILTALATSPFTAEIEWTVVSSPDLGSYSLEITGSNGTTVLAFHPSSTRVALDSLAPEQQYTATLRAVDTAGNGSAPSSMRFQTYPDEAPPPPVAVVAHDTGTGGTVTASWTIPESRVPIERFIVSYEPLEAGWPAHTIDVTDPRDDRAGLVNQLQYLVHVRGVTPWGREGQSAVSSVVEPTKPAMPIPILGRTGRIGDDGLEDSAGIQIVLPPNPGSRLLRLVYRALGTDVRVVLNGQQLETSLGDTNGDWIEAEIPLALDQIATNHFVRLVASSFPAFSAEAAFDRVDFEPLPARRLSTTGFDSVVDVEVERAETRSDLALVVERAGELSRGRPVIPGDRVTLWETLSCRNPLGNVCRDAFLTDNTRYVYRVGIRSPAGWISSFDSVQGETRPPYVPPPVTDLTVTTYGIDGSGGYRLDWTPVSCLDRNLGEPVAIPTYRIYSTDGASSALVHTVTAPPASLPAGKLPAGHWFVVRTVDALGRESR